MIVPLHKVLAAIWSVFVEIDIFPRTICYDGYGCFTTARPFSGTLERPVALLPNSPEKIATSFLLYTRSTIHKGEILHRQIQNFGHFASNKKTKIIIHGFLDNSNLTWEDVNLIIVNWTQGNTLPYTKAVANAQIVGIDVAHLIETLITKTNTTLERFHIIGHSLGAHIAGYAGARLPGIARITGLDPAGPYFENTDERVRLDQTDALFVDVIHTDAIAPFELSLGISQAIGHVDFYPNGGQNQPECSQTAGKILNGLLNYAFEDAEGIIKTTVCSHFAAVHYFTDSILKNSCSYTAFSCLNYNAFKSNQCFLLCNNDAGCNQMGYYADPSRSLGKHYLYTRNIDQKNYCGIYLFVYHYQIVLYSDRNGFLSARGEAILTFISNKSMPLTMLFGNEMLTYTSNSIKTWMIPLQAEPIDEPIQVNIKFRKTKEDLIHWFYTDKWRFIKLVFIDGQKQIKYTFCPNSYPRTHTIFLPCVNN
ncbi:unnamed protein product [Didymodactylos carnosus]|uniref:Lipase domain-containing protein n=1 Tax=Didymodactylos carnosus TaxID=1234261 RepID=A0A813P9Z8_9BILA|nr:unnamed protein product [Didymodactylos carnosus]CAF0747515.1 unnamed protein product [Didymodactylos carnosus]CAF3523232.1 unnamed protein product [Didymodactylos carnosus]CAF3526552.1 unnamed protein product [Didymodactylos carnosus]